MGIGAPSSVVGFRAALAFEFMGFVRFPEGECAVGVEIRKFVHITP